MTHGMSDIQQCRDAGFATHMSKPVSIARLGEVIAGLAGRER
jgi:CheY-like chemotaxis protein